MSTIQFGSLPVRIHPFVFKGSRYEVVKESFFSSKRVVYKDGVYSGSISPKAFSNKFIISTSDGDYIVNSRVGFKNITIVKDRSEVGKVSRKTHWFTSDFGVAVSDEIDSVLVFLAIIFKLRAARGAI